MSLLDYESHFSNLKMNSRGGSEKSPHKVAMLLAIIDLIEAETVTDNRIYFDQNLRDKFKDHFDRLAGPQDRNNPHLPYFHLRSSGFWHHRVKPGSEAEYAALTTPSGPGAVTNNISFVQLDDELYELLSFGVARELLRAALYRNLSRDDVSSLLEVGNGWDWLECEAIVRDYFAMLNLELAGESYNKTEHRSNLKTLLNGRGDGSIEYKHQNISAILLEMGQPYIQGYKPAYNYQAQLKSVVLAYLAGHQTELDYMLESASEAELAEPAAIDWSIVLDAEIPEKLATIQEPKRKYAAVKLNFSEREQANRSLGENGEAFVIEYERHRLRALNRADLAKEVEWSSRDRGDGLGYDVRSFNPSQDEELFIEVKTTNSGKYQPFFITDNELDFSKEKSAQYSLYRVFDFKQRARIYQLNGAVDQYVHLQPKSFKASFS
ncbi:DUF3883 domain-containing protein [Pseudohalioglobus lutimaris]|uniref:DUF3883 domain-containing protein n=1 Tax=Pseudohalioglobus lutimaris TaxID=1737061 RepID=A0A2N5X7L6_9GAMM|nr:DUF3883 domain-containing protein [Pseudohalioglobus lutimaris]PLW70477.1 DUF3883 domain-containing protein [Pseudohalioglobus lutimaris]